MKCVSNKEAREEEKNKNNIMEILFLVVFFGKLTPNYTWRERITAQEMNKDYA